MRKKHIAISFLSWLQSHSIKHLRVIRVVSCVTNSLLLLQSGIPLYGYTTICSSVCQLMSICLVCGFWYL